MSRSSTTVLLCMLSALCLGAACSPDEASSGSDGGDAVCECIAPDEVGFDSSVCSPRSCGLVDRRCVHGEGGEGDEHCDGWGRLAVNEVALDCALDDLIMGRTGEILYEDLLPGTEDHTIYYPHGFMWGGFIQVLPARRGLGRDWTWASDDEGYSLAETAAAVHRLKEPAYFETCKAEPDPLRRFNCFLAWRAGEPLRTCDPAEVVRD
jgi:hypothetical protein